jgi:Na+/serine symporter
MKILLFLAAATAATVTFAYPQKVADTLEQLKSVPSAIGEGLKNLGMEFVDKAVESHQKFIGGAASVVRTIEEKGPLPFLPGSSSRTKDFQ